jgi:hypothetical protein
VGVAHVRGLRAAWATDMLKGAGIVCWTRASVLSQFDGQDAHLHPTPLDGGGAPFDPDVDVRVDIQVPAGLNYAQLHQRRYPAFKTFRLWLRKGLAVPDVNLEVRLNGEDRELAWRARIDLKAPFVDLRQAIQFPLTAPLARSCRESVVTTMYVKIEHDGKVLHCGTYTTRLLPADQWSFSHDNAQTLASFVFPRDPEVERLVLAAQKYVRVLRDDATAGFEGYQAQTQEEVDLQVRALWSALLHEYRLGYINPPPAYSHEQDSQRLRTPTNVLKGGWGTCVDLALLLAAALELIDIYPTLFVLRQHAFAGYWRSPDARDRFMRVGASVGSWDDGSFNTRMPVNGMFLSSSLEEIRTYIESGELVVLEATCLTSGGSFSEAMALGWENLDDAQEFEYMIDLLSARIAQITPLPLGGGHA